MHRKSVMSCRDHHCISGATLALALVATAACTDGVTRPRPADAEMGRAAEPVVDLNLQPEPPSSLALRFELNPDGADWFGTVYVGDRACGYMQLLHPRSGLTGIVDHVEYRLSIQGDNPDYVLDAGVSGVIANHHLVLNGRIGSGYYAGETIHPRGDITPAPDGPVDVLTTMKGLIQLYPQPEPPSFVYPPSPCLGG
ncbi:MAG: hypothetical protein LJF04_03225 [Gemmatimonadetes bacterium]|nr:hypothetical protein [Gemmatimonadota bacterium]